MGSDALGYHVKQVAVKVTTGKPVSAEDVHIAAIAWAFADQRNEAAAGSTTAADLDLLAVINAHTGVGDAAGQAVCDAAYRWRDRTRLDRGDEPAQFRWLLAYTVDRHRRTWWQKNRARIAMGWSFLVGVCVSAAGVMILETMGPLWVRQLAVAVTAVVCAVWVALAFAIRNAGRR